MKNIDTESSTTASDDIVKEIIKDVERLFIEKVLAHISAIVHSKIDSYIKDFLNSSTDALAQVIKLFCLIIVATLVLLFASVALALWLDELLGSLMLGFLLVAMLYLILFLVINRIGSKLLKSMLPKQLIINAIDNKNT